MLANSFSRIALQILPGAGQPLPRSAADPHRSPMPAHRKEPRSLCSLGAGL
jgi:hypothetical protein